MIRKANTQDLASVLPILQEDSSRALFILGDIEAYGLETEFQELWVDADEQGIHAVILRYYENLVWYLVDQLIDVEGFKERIDDQRIVNTGCTRSHFEQLPPSIKDSIKARYTYLCECRQLKEGHYTAVLATPEDAPLIIAGLEQIEEFASTQVLTIDERITRLADDLLKQKNYAMIIKNDQQVISHAMSAAHTQYGAMIIGVFTLKDYRHQGLARQIMGGISRYLLDKNMTPVLFYDNPDAGKLYHDLGYETIDQWVMGTKVSSS